MSVLENVAETLAEELARLEREASRVRAALTAVQSVLLDRSEAPAPAEAEPARQVKRRRGERVTREKVRDAARALGRFKLAELADHVGAGSRQTVRPHIDALMASGAVRRHGGPRDPNTYYTFERPAPGGPSSAPRGEPNLAVVGVGAAAQARGNVVPHTRPEGPSGKPGRDKARARAGVRVKRQRQGS